MQSRMQIPDQASFARPHKRDPYAELTSRELAARSLIDFTTYTYSKYKVDHAHILIADTLQAAMEDKLPEGKRKLMIFAPPQMGKSEIVSVRFPAFWMAKRPTDPIILTSYTGDLAESKASDARRIVESQLYQNVFPEGVAIDPLTKGRFDWRMEGRRGGILAAGILGSITGHPAALGIIDDPHKNWTEAQSKSRRDSVWAWYRGTFRTRIWENGVIALITTRWHTDDLAGRLIASQREEWHILRLPAIAETDEERLENNKKLMLDDMPDQQHDPLGRAPGEALTPQRFSISYLLKTKRDVGSLVWWAEYQGSPRPPEGLLIKRDQLIRTTESFTTADFSAIVRYWDRGGVEGGGARTAGVLAGRHRDGRIIYLNVKKGQWSSFKRNQNMKLTADNDKLAWGAKVIQWIEREPSWTGKETLRSTVAAMVGHTVKADPPVVDKITRGVPFMAQAEAGNIYYVPADWNEEWIDEITSVPNSAFMDQWDGTVGALNKLATGFWSR